MSEEKKSFLDSNLYPILFMLAATILFVGILAIFYHSTEAGIARTQKQTYQLQILSTLADEISKETKIPTTELLNRSSLDKHFSAYIKERRLPSPHGVTVDSVYYEANINGKTLGYCFDVTGSGLWGTMHGLLALSPDYKHILNFFIYSQMETPGLGARVEENWFKVQFVNKPVLADNHTSLATFTLIPENSQPQTYEIKQITGASITSSSVLKILSDALQELAHHFPILTPGSRQ